MAGGGKLHKTIQTTLLLFHFFSVILLFSIEVFYCFKTNPYRNAARCSRTNHRQSVVCCFQFLADNFFTVNGFYDCLCVRIFVVAAYGAVRYCVVDVVHSNGKLLENTQHKIHKKKQMEVETMIPYKFRKVKRNSKKKDQRNCNLIMLRFSSFWSIQYVSRFEILTADL